MNNRDAVRVLVVDDHSDTLETLGRLVKMIGCQARACMDGKRCIEVVKEFQPHAIFLDIGMPGMDGYAVARELKKLELPAFLLVALTGFADPEHREKCVELGFDQFLIKPASLEQLRSVIADASRLFRASDSSIADA